MGIYLPPNIFHHSTDCDKRCCSIWHRYFLQLIHPFGGYDHLNESLQTFATVQYWFSTKGDVISLIVRVKTSVFSRLTHYQCRASSWNWLMNLVIDGDCTMTNLSYTQKRFRRRLEGANLTMMPCEDEWLEPIHSPRAKHTANRYASRSWLGGSAEEFALIVLLR